MMMQSLYLISLNLTITYGKEVYCNDVEKIPCDLYCIVHVDVPILVLTFESNFFQSLLFHASIFLLKFYFWTRDLHCMVTKITVIRSAIFSNAFFFLECLTSSLGALSLGRVKKLIIKQILLHSL